MSVRPEQYDLIRKPVITEKATMASEGGAVVFEVAIDATKPQIKEAIEALFNVKVKAQTTVRRGGKSKKVNFVETTSCPSGGWPFKADFSFDEQAPFVDEPLTAVSPVSKC